MSTTSDFKALLKSTDNFDLSFEEWKAPPTNSLSTGRDMGVAYFAEQTRLETDPKRANTYRFLSRLCGLMFEPHNRAQPFKPPGNPEASVHVEDLTPEMARAIADAALDVPLAPLRARLLDFVHPQLGRTRRSAASQAIDAYTEGVAALEEPHWEIKALQRAHSLSVQYSLPQAEAVKELVYSKLHGATKPFDIAAQRLRLLEGLFELGWNPLDEFLAMVQTEISNLSSKPAHIHQAFLDLQRRVQHKTSSGAGKGDPEATLRAMAAAKVQEASRQPNAVRRVHRLKQADALYRQIGDGKMRDLCAHALAQQQKTLVEEELEEHGGEIQVENLFSHIEQTVIEPSNSWLEAHTRLALYFVSHLPEEGHLQDLARDFAGEFLYLHFAAQTQLNREGETIAHSEGGSTEPHFWMYLRLRLENLAVQLAWVQYRLLGKLGPLQLTDIQDVVDGVCVEEFQHRTSLARGLYRGWGGDWQVSMGLLLPILENLIRLDLPRVGQVPFRITDDDIQQKYLLGHMLDKNANCFAPKYQLGLRAVLIDNRGYNLRNLYCHGLIPDDQIHWPACMLAWGLTLAHIFFPRPDLLIFPGRPGNVKP